jgi:hypothetical protein
MMKLGAHDDEGPALTTRAVKELEKAQKTIVYSKTLIKINLPDKVCLQAYFHPRDTIHDVAEWLRSECFAAAATEDGSPMKTEESEAAGVVSSLASEIDFDLYTTPPRRTLFSTANIEVGGGATGSGVSLSELSLVPAAVVHLVWKGASVQEFGSDGNANHSYLSAPLIARLQTEVRDQSEADRTSFPSGQKLVPENKNAGDQADEKDRSSRGGNTLVGSSSSSSAGGSKGGGKPKWFKL